MTGHLDTDALYSEFAKWIAGMNDEPSPVLVQALRDGLLLGNRALPSAEDPAPVSVGGQNRLAARRLLA